MKILRSDWGGKYINATQYCDTHGIILENTVPHTPEQNGVAERANRKILDKGHTIMRDADAPNFLWADAFATTVYAINQTMSGHTPMMTPYKAFFRRKPSISHMRIWYSDTFIHQPKDLGAGKLGERGHQVEFLGYPDNTAGYKVYNPHTHKVSIIHAPIFREEAQPHPNAIFKTEESDDEVDNPMTTVTDVLPKMDQPWKRTQPTGCSLSHQCPECSGYVLRVITTHIQTEGKTKVN